VGSIVKRGTRARPRYYIQFRDLDGRLKMRVVADARSKEDAASVLAQVEGRIASGKRGFEEVDDRMCAVVMDEWIQGIANRNADDDRSRYRRHIRPYFADLPLERAQHLAVVMTWLDRLQRDHDISGQTARHAMGLLSRFWSWAAERGFAKVNPVKMIPQGRRPKASNGAGEEGEWLRDEEVGAQLMAELPEPLALMWWLGNRSGLRMGEAAGLRMEDFAWMADGILRVAHSYDGPLKEDKGNRSKPKVKWAPLAEDAEEVIGPWLARRKAEGAKPGELVFPFVPKRRGHTQRKSTWTGYRKEHLEDCWDTAADVVGVALTWYATTRHTFVSRNLAGGAPLDEISAAIGHSSPEVTKRFYAHYIRKTFSPALRAPLPKTSRRDSNRASRSKPGSGGTDEPDD
jgi:integrase